LPRAILELELLLSDSSLNLEAVTNVIRNDLGLTLQLLRLTARENDGRTDILSISDLVVLAGLQRLRAMAAESTSVPTGPRDQSRATPCERFWMHSRLTAHIAAELATEISSVCREEAYLSGMFFHLSSLPSLLNWDMPTKNPGDAICEMAKEWNLPASLADVIRGRGDLCRTAESRVLFDLASVANTWAYRLEFLAARESEWVRAKIPPHVNRARLEL
jgi:HD-like signal output (HDOD) protein